MKIIDTIKGLFQRKPKQTPDEELFELLAGSWLEDDSLVVLRAKRVSDALARGANPNAIEPASGYPLWRAAAGEPVLLEVLITGGADIKAANGMDLACFGEHPKSLRLLLDSGLDPNMEFQGETLVHYLWTLFDEQHGAKDALQSFLDVLSAGANIDGLSKHGYRKPYAPSITIEKVIKAQKGLAPTHKLSTFKAMSAVVAKGAKPNHKQRKKKVTA